MTITLIYKYNKHFLEKKFLKEFKRISSDKDLELVILNDEKYLEKDFTKFKEKFRVSKKFKFASVEKVSLSFLYNRGIDLASGDFVGILNTTYFLPTSFVKFLKKAFSKNEDAFIFVEKPLSTNLKEKHYILNLYMRSFFENLRLFQAPFFLNKKILKKEGLYFDENIEFISVLELIKKAIDHSYKVVPLKKSSFNLQVHIKEAKDIGLNLFRIFDRNQQGVFLLSKKVLSEFLKKPLFISLVFMGIVYGRFYKKVIISLFKFLRKANCSLIELCRKKKLINPLLFPTELMIEPTNFCNAGCPLCPTGSGQLKRPVGYLDFSLFKEIIDDGKFYLKRILLWNMGEPFFNKDIYSIIQYAKRFDIEVISSSNGHSVRDLAAVNRLLYSGIDRLIIGVDGIGQKTFSLYRKGLSYEKVIRGLMLVQKQKKLLNKNFPVIEFQMILMKQNSHQIERAYSLAKKLGTEFKLKYVNLNMVDNETKKSYLPKDKNSHVYKLIDKRSLFREKKNNLPCVIWDGMVVNWDGTVNPCIFDYYATKNLGNSKNHSLLKVWRSRSFKKFRRSVITDKAAIDLCKDCPINERYSELYIL